MLTGSGQHSSHFFEAFFEAADDACCVVATAPESSGQGAFQLLRANASFQEFVASRRVPPGDIHRLLAGAGWAELVTGVLASGEPVRACMALEPHGWVDLHVFAMPEPGVVGLRLRDVSEHRRMVERLIGLRRITTVGVLSWGPGFGLLDVNEGFERMTGFTREEAIGKTWQELTPAEHHAASWRAVHQVTSSGEAVPYEKEYFGRDGRRCWGCSRRARSATR